MKTIETRRLILRKFKPDDCAALFRFVSRSDNSIYTFYWPNTEEGTRAFISRAIGKAEEVPCTEFQYAAVTKAEDLLIGSCNFLPQGEGGSNLGWIVDSD